MDHFHFPSLKIILLALLKEKKAREVKIVWFPIPSSLESQKRQEMSWGRRLDKMFSKKTMEPRIYYIFYCSRLGLSLQVLFHVIWGL